MPLQDWLGPTGVWGTFDHWSVGQIVDYARRAEELGYDCFWVNESLGREPFALLGLLAASTSGIPLGLGVAPIHARDATAAHAGARTIAEATGGRFIMGLGVSHASSAAARGHDYTSPLATLERYLREYREAPYRAVLPDHEPPLVVAALRPRALRLAARTADGVFPYLVTAEYVARARSVIDAAHDDRLHRPALIVTQAVVADDDPIRARSAARSYLAGHLRQPNYRASLIHMGYREADLDDGGSDRLVDDLVAHGSRQDLQAAVARMHGAGADHVAVIPISPQGSRADWAGLEAARPAS
ncbi:MAG: LLM class flavin-dependent oxidoreductase [Gammaproteobacteria bacterium]|nr:LLM class flavin-dependent oxidoreductase [Gammaproteobacteria bacterium]